ncbi:MAG TPA: hypothetical protein PKZ75_12965 [Bacteroidia bacterium]|jgi:hypothetical protein|nr:hypothetical protein [Bacteroidia bacterium]
MKIESNLGTTLLSLKNAFVNDLPIVTEKALRLAGLDAVVLVADRIQQKGNSVSGRMTTKSKKPDGVYSKGHKKTRDKRNLQTSHVDLTFSGDLMRNWQLLSSDTKSAEIGFMNDSESDKAGYLEDYYGQIFALTKDEENAVIETFNSEIETTFVKKMS